MSNDGTFFDKMCNMILTYTISGLSHHLLLIIWNIFYYTILIFILSVFLSYTLDVPLPIIYPLVLFFVYVNVSTYVNPSYFPHVPSFSQFSYFSSITSIIASTHTPQSNFSDHRRTQFDRIQKLIDIASKEKYRVVLFVTYERLNGFKKYFDFMNKGNNKYLREFKHWKLVLMIGFDEIILDFSENSKIRGEGVIRVLPFKREDDLAGLYPLGQLDIDTHTLYTDILKMFHSWSEYSVTRRNCQHFVIFFIQKYQYCMKEETDHCKHIRDIDPNRITLISQVGEFFQGSFTASL